MNTPISLAVARDLSDKVQRLVTILEEAENLWNEIEIPQEVKGQLGERPKVLENAKRGPGRPRKNPEPAQEGEAKRGPGRPRKNPEAQPEANGEVKRGPGRPRKNPAPVPQEGEVKRGPGRPRKNPEAQPAAAVVAENKIPPLKQLLQQIAEEVKKPMALKDFIVEVHKRGYKSDAKDFSNLVYQKLVSLAHDKVFIKDVSGESIVYSVKNAA